MFEQYYPILILFGLIGIIVSVIVILSTIVGPRKETRQKYRPFEAGSQAVGEARSRFSVKFYVVAIIFILFDIETVFLYPWAVMYSDFAAAGMAGLMFVEMAVFVAVLTVGLVYVWRKGALEWE